MGHARSCFGPPFWVFSSLDQFFDKLDSDYWMHVVHHPAGQEPIAVRKVPHQFHAMLLTLDAMKPRERQFSDVGRKDQKQSEGQHGQRSDEQEAKPDVEKRVEFLVDHVHR